MLPKLLLGVVVVVVIGAAAVLGGGWLLLSGVGQGYDADDLVDDTLDAVELTWSRHAGTVSPGEDLAVMAVRESWKGGRTDSPEDSVRVEALDWSGETGTDDGATVALRLVAHVEDYDAPGVFAHDHPEDDVVRCVTYTLGAGDRRDVDPDRHSCPEDAVARSPRFQPEPVLPADTEEQMRSVLEEATPETAEATAEQRLGGDGLVVQTVVEDPADGGRIVVTVGVGSFGDCVVGVKEPDGTVDLPTGFPREWLMPGELGCSPALVLNAPR